MYFLRAAKPILIDLAGTFFFLAIYLVAHNIALAIASGMALGIGQVAFAKLRRQPVPALQWTSLGLVLTLGGASLVLHDPRFIMAKPSVVFIVIGATMLRPGWLARYAPAIVTDNLSARTIAAWGYAWPALMGALAVANLIVATVMRFEFWL
jgi:intracellular septation protein A